jgi:Protein of unknown function (DUF998)
MMRRALLICGIICAPLYVAIDVLAAVRYGEYHRFASQAISELSAVGAPTQSLVDPLLTAFALLLGAFGIGVGSSAGGCRRLRLIAGLLVGVAILSLVWPPMYLRGAGGLSRDLPHMLIGAVVFGLVATVLALGASLEGQRFRAYSRRTLAVVVVAGALSGFEAIRLELGQPTPWIGLVERLGVGAALLWVMALALKLIRSRASGAA